MENKIYGTTTIVIEPKLEFLSVDPLKYENFDVVVIGSFTVVAMYFKYSMLVVINLSF